MTTTRAEQEQANQTLEEVLTELDTQQEANDAAETLDKLQTDGLDTNRAEKDKRAYKIKRTKTGGDQHHKKREA